MKTAFTPGPWEISTYTNYVGFAIFVSNPTAEMRGCIAERWFSYELNERQNQECLSNAHLIAAAPDLYAALKAWIDSDNTDFYAIVGHDSDGHPLNAAGVARTMARAALAKAEGVQP